MESFVTFKSYKWRDLIREVCITLAIIVIIIVVVLFWFPERLTIFTVIFASLMLLVDVFGKASRPRLQKLIFDTQSKEMVLFFESLLSDVKQKRLPFDGAGIEVLQVNSKLKIPEPVALYIMKGKIEIFEVNTSKDGVSIETIRQIIFTAQNQSIPIVLKP